MVWNQLFMASSFVLGYGDNEICAPKITGRAGTAPMEYYALWQFQLCSDARVSSSKTRVSLQIE